jgi:biotin operon repressor
MSKEDLLKLAEALEQAGYKIEALNRIQDNYDLWTLEISPLQPFKGKN